VVLSCLENRLDVIVYRLNWAPSILWARRLIWEGSIFVNNIKKMEAWNIMYSSLKKHSFPLKLRDPKKLYCVTYWNPQKYISKYKFVSRPQTKIAYLVQPGDIIQSRAALINHFKNYSFLFNKQSFSHLLSAIRTKLKWSWSSHKISEHSFVSWEQQSEYINTAFFLFNPQFKDIPYGDRMDKSFLRWASL
jgi:hypothetical protein